MLCQLVAVSQSRKEILLTGLQGSWSCVLRGSVSWAVSKTCCSCPPGLTAGQRQPKRAKEGAVGPCLRGSKRSRVRRAQKWGHLRQAWSSWMPRWAGYSGTDGAGGGVIRRSDSLQFFTVLCQPSDREKISTHTGGMRTERGEAL